MIPHTHSYVEVLTPTTSEYDLIWRQNLYRGDQAKVRSLEQALIQYEWYPYKKGKFGHRDMHTGRMPCEYEVGHLQTKEA